MSPSCNFTSLHCFDNRTVTFLSTSSHRDQQFFPSDAHWATGCMSRCCESIQCSYRRCGFVGCTHWPSLQIVHKIKEIIPQDFFHLVITGAIDYKQLGLQHIMLLFIGAVDLVKLFPGHNGFQSQFNVDKVYPQLQLVRKPCSITEVHCSGSVNSLTSTDNSTLTLFMQLRKCWLLWSGMPCWNH